MPIYEFKCPECGTKLDIAFKTWREAVDTKLWCPNCQDPTHMERLISSGSFKVQGFAASNGYSKRG